MYLVAKAQPRTIKIFTDMTQPQTLGQFIQRDPIGFAAGDLNLYAYVWNDPYSWTDPGWLNAAAIGGGYGSNTAAALDINKKANTPIAAGTLSLANRIRAALSAINFAVANSNGSNAGSNSESSSDDQTNDDCLPSDPNCNNRPSDCDGPPGFGLRISSGDQRIGGSLKNLPLTNITAVDAFRLLGHFETSVAARLTEKRDLASRGLRLDAGHKRRLVKETEIRNRLRDKSKNADC